MKLRIFVTIDLFQMNQCDGIDEFELVQEVPEVETRLEVSFLSIASRSNFVGNDALFPISVLNAIMVTSKKVQAFFRLAPGHMIHKSMKGPIRAKVVYDL